MNGTEKESLKIQTKPEISLKFEPMQHPLDVLKEYWGYDSFRPGQQDIIETVLKGDDALALLPTGGGKSICFQVPGMIRKGVTVVVSPLIALMQDQVSNLKKKGMRAASLDSSMDFEALDAAFDNAVYGGLDFIYVSPERLKTDLFIQRFKKMEVALIAVDEAHCVSQWGYDFRPPYLEIAKLRDYHPDVPFLALTATATPKVVEDIMDQLNFKKRNAFKNSFERPNLTYITLPTNNKMDRIISYSQMMKGTGIVYTDTRKKTKEIASLLIQNGVSADYYHGGLDPKSRKKKQEAWINNQIRIIVSTNAFGMGIDKPDVRFVLHHDIPENIENYFQEAGRGGRDLKKSRAILFYETVDIKKLEEKVTRKYPEKEFLRKVYGHLGSYFNLAFGAGEGQVYPLDIGIFCKKYELDPLLTFNALQILMRNSYIKLSESLMQPLRVKFTATPVDLYNFQIKFPTFEPLIKMILRAYTGVYDHLVALDESALINRLNMTRSTLLKLLQQMEKMELLEFKASHNGPEVEWLQDRLDHNHLYIDPETYDRRKEDALIRLENMLNFLSNEACRSKFLLQYFGEEDAPKCGKCNVCLSIDEEKMEGYFLQMLTKSILNYFEKNGKVTKEKLFFDFSKYPEKILKESVQFLVNEDKIFIKGNEIVFKN